MCVCVCVCVCPRHYAFVRALRWVVVQGEVLIGLSLSERRGTSQQSSVTKAAHSGSGSTRRRHAGMLCLQLS